MQVVRLMLDTLHSLGFSNTAATLTREAAAALGESGSLDATVAQLRESVLVGDWARCLAILPVAPFAHRTADLPVVLMAVLRQQYLEMIGRHETRAGLQVLRDQIQPVQRHLARWVGGVDGGATHQRGQHVPTFAASIPFSTLPSAASTVVHHPFGSSPRSSRPSRVARLRHHQQLASQGYSGTSATGTTSTPSLLPTSSWTPQLGASTQRGASMLLDRGADDEDSGEDDDEDEAEAGVVRVGREPDTRPLPSVVPSQAALEPTVIRTSGGDIVLPAIHSSGKLVPASRNTRARTDKAATGTATSGALRSAGRGDGGGQAAGERSGIGGEFEDTDAEMDNGVTTESEAEATAGDDTMSASDSTTVGGSTPVGPLLLDHREQSYLTVAAADPVLSLSSDTYWQALAALALHAGNPASLRVAAHWDGPLASSPGSGAAVVDAGACGSRSDLLHLIERRLSDAVVPPLRLPALLGQAIQRQLEHCPLRMVPSLPSMQQHASSTYTLLHDHVCGQDTCDTLPSRCIGVLQGHSDEVWGVKWSPTPPPPHYQTRSGTSQAGQLMGAAAAPTGSSQQQHHQRWLSSFDSSGRLLVWDVSGVTLSFSSSSSPSASSISARPRYDLSFADMVRRLEQHGRRDTEASSARGRRYRGSGAGSRAGQDGARGNGSTASAGGGADAAAAVADGTPRDATNGSSVAVTITINQAASRHPLTCQAWSSDGTMLAVAGTRTSVVLVVMPGLGAERQVSASASAGGGGGGGQGSGVSTAIVRLGLDTGHPGGIAGLAWSSAGLVAGGVDGGVWMWTKAAISTLTGRAGQQHAPVYSSHVSAFWPTPRVNAVVSSGRGRSQTNITAGATNAGVSSAPPRSRPASGNKSGTEVGSDNDDDPSSLVVALVSESKLLLINTSEPSAPMVEQDAVAVVGGRRGCRAVAACMDPSARYVLLAVHATAAEYKKSTDTGPGVSTGETTLGGLGLPPPPPATGHGRPRAPSSSSSTASPPGHGGSTSGLGTRLLSRIFGVPMALGTAGSSFDRPPPRLHVPARGPGLVPATAAAPAFRFPSPMAAAGSGTGGGRSAGDMQGPGMHRVRLAIDGSAPARLILWDLATASAVATFTGHTNSSSIIEPSFATGAWAGAAVCIGSEEGGVYMWHWGTGQLLRELRGHASSVNACDWATMEMHTGSENRRGGGKVLVASASDDTTIRIWAR